MLNRLLSMLISIITASFNSEKTIEATIQSVLNQSFKDFQYIVVDGNSLDNTINIIESFKNNFKEKGIGFKYISENDKGIYDAWNKGVRLADGEWIGFLGSDDRLYEDALFNYAKLIKENNDLEYISSKIITVKNGKKLAQLTGQWNWNTFKKHMCVSHVGSLHSREYFDKYGLYDTSYKIAGDYELLLRAGPNLKYAFLDDFTAEMEMGGVSNNMVVRTLKETKRAKIDTGKTNTFWATVYYVYALLKAKIKSVL